MTITINGKEFLSTDEAMHFLQVARRTIYNLKEAGKLHPYKQGIRRTPYWPRTELEEIKRLRQVDDIH